MSQLKSILEANTLSLPKDHLYYWEVTNGTFHYLNFNKIAREISY
tara:strand:- start:3 stop:137 length:135 start_codon:yes stop_codon:yes gene_type:complete